MAITFCHKKTMLVFFDKRPNTYFICFWYVQVFNVFHGEKLEAAFRMLRWKGGKSGAVFKKKHHPMMLAFMACFTDDPFEIEI